MPLWKFGVFVIYNAFSLTGMYFYGVKLRGLRAPPTLNNRNAYSITKLFSKGVQHSVNPYSHRLS